MSRRRPLLRLSAALLALATLTACGGSSEEAGPGSSGSGSSPGASEDPGQATGAARAFPVTIEHALGTTEIPEEPQRVVTWGWASADAAIALGVVPVAIPTQSYGGDEQGVLPWIREAVEAQDAEMPTVLPESQEAPVEAIAAADPDVILAPYSGITETEYAQLSRIAPTVAYPDEPWATPWRDVVETVGTALGREAQARQVLDDIDAAVAEQAEAHPELEGKSIALVWDTADAFYVYKPADPRVEFTLDLGFESAPSVQALSSGEETFYYTLSEERLAELDSDVLVSYADSEDAATAFLESPSAQVMEQVQDGTVASVVGAELIASVSPPTALSLTWGLEDYVAALSEAASAADAS